MAENIMQKRLLDLTGEELLALLEKSGLKNQCSNEPTFTPSTEKNYVYGISGLAKLLNCSNVTAQKIKNSGDIDNCFSQIGRKLVFDSGAVLLKLRKGESNENN